jgi:hypothetical protein
MLTSSGYREETSGNAGAVIVGTGIGSVGAGIGVSDSTVSVGSTAGTCVGGGMVSIPTSKVLHPATKIDSAPTNKTMDFIEFLDFMINTSSLIDKYRNILFCHKYIKALLRICLWYVTGL